MAAAGPGLLAGLKELAAQAWELEQAVEHYGPETQPALAARMSHFAASVAELQGQTGLLEGVRIPEDLLEYLDAGGNPNKYTAEVFQACTRDNQASKGKVEAVQSLWDSLLSKLEGVSPEQAAAYRQLLQQSGASVVPSALQQGKPAVKEGGNS